MFNLLSLSNLMAKIISGPMVDKLILARNHIDKMIKLFASEANSFVVIKESQKAQSLLRDFDCLLGKSYLRICLTRLAKDSEPDVVIKEVVKLHKYLN